MGCRVEDVKKPEQRPGISFFNLAVYILLIGVFVVAVLWIFLNFSR